MKLSCRKNEPRLHFFVVNFICFVVLRVHSYKYKERYVDVPIDHFSFSDRRTFSLRYCVNDSFWEPNSGPIFFYTGGESRIEDYVEKAGFMWESAARFRARVVFAEHRFYGKSMPFGTLSLKLPKYYSYLTTQQALADFLDVIYHLKREKKRSSYNDIPNPVIAFGGSYAGMLAAWMRMKYPAIIEGSLASSAPMWDFPGMTPCDAKAKKITSIYAHTSEICSKTIRMFWDELMRVTKTKKGRLQFSRNWQLCHPLKTKDDVRRFRKLLQDMFGIAAIANHPYPTTYLNIPLPAHPVKEMCSYLNGSNYSGDLLVETVSKTARMFFNHTGKSPCLYWNLDGRAAKSVHAWSVQTCLDMVMPFCSNGVTDMFFPLEWTFQEWDKKCYSKYKLHPMENVVEKLYGAKDIDAASNIIFSNGELDPWTAGGVTRDVLSPSVTVIMLADAAHCLDLRAAHVNDPPSVKHARELYEETFKKWITTYYEKRRTFHSESRNKRKAKSLISIYHRLFTRPRLA